MVGATSRTAASRTIFESSINFSAHQVNKGALSSKSLLFQGHFLHTNRPVFISAALLTTQTNGSPLATATASSLRAFKRRHQPKHGLVSFPLGLPHNQLGALSYYSSSSGGPPRGGGSRMGMLGGALGAGALLFGKGKYLLGALKLTKFASLGSMVLSVGAYSMIFGLPYAVGMVGLILVHESEYEFVS